ncbi:DUF885 domain-containing protein [Riemerella columbina]|uniref:DUF885 domain-containing protein n=1 Tax=Riemerella columbina TaxID=103810 RepID=UPI0003653FB2|nr:DUF885 domain-containing protein [Riemerella columbina]
MKLGFRIIIATLLALVFSCKKKDTPLNVPPVHANLDSIAEEYYDGYLKFHPFEATAQGDRRFNDILPQTIDKVKISEETSFYNSIIKKLEGIDYDQLTDAQKVVYNVLDHRLKDQIEGYAYHPEYFPFTQFEGLPLEFPLLGSGKGSQPFENKEDYENWLKRMEAFPAWMDTAIEDFKLGIKDQMVLPKKLVVKMIPQMSAEELTSTNPSKNIFFKPIQNFPKGMSAADRAHYTKEYNKVILEQVIPAYQKMATFLEKDYLPHARTTDGYNALPKGNEIYNYYVKHWTTTSETPETIHEKGLKEVERIRGEMEQVKQQVGFNGSLEEFLTFVKSDPKAKPYQTSQQILDAFNGILTKIEPKLETMFTVVPKTGFEIRQTEKFREASASAEYQPGTPDGKRNGIFYIPIPDPKAFNVTSGMESLFLHEAIPGHHYQIALQQENMALPKFMRFGWIGAYGEGWALYCESLGPEFGLYTDPYQKMGALSDEMMRAVRLVVDTGIHTGKMAREQALTYFLNHVAYDEAAATAEIERYMANPGQALSYKTGSMKIQELRKKYQEQLGTQFSLAKFHDELLNQGCLPLQILEQKMDRWAKRPEQTKKQ